MLFKKLIRTAGRYKAQFISMIIMTALGIGMFVGFNMEWVSININTMSFFENTGFADYRIVSEEGFSEEEADKIAAINGVDAVSRYVSVNADVTGSDNVLAVTVTENPDVSDFVLMEGEPYDAESEDGVWLFDHYASANNISVGDKIEMKYDNFTFGGTVKGLIESSEYLICIQDETQMMPNYTKFGYVYITPVQLKNVITDYARTKIHDAAIDAAREAMGDLYSEEAAEELAEKAVDEELEDAVSEAYDEIYPQINVISDMDTADFKKAADDALGKTLVVLTKDETTSYSESQGEADEGKAMGSILPVLFLLIAFLTMVTTMHRIASNEKTQIGTLKALGFKDRRILIHYSSYTLMIGIVGSVLGIALGYLLAWLMMNPNGAMGTYIAMPEWKLELPWWCVAITVAVIILMVIIGAFSTKQMLKGTAADALRPYVPKASKPMLIEKTGLWDKLRFGTRWNLRDIMRHKSRSIVTLIGVFGCTLLIVAGFGMYETANAFITTNFSDNASYASKAFISADASNEDALKLAEEYDADFSASLSVQANEETFTLDIYHIEHGLIGFKDADLKTLALPDDGVLCCLRVQKEFGLKVGDEITLSLFGTDDKYTVKIAGFNRSMTEGFTMSDTYAETLMCDGNALTDNDQYVISSIYTKTAKSDISNKLISNVQSKDDIASAMDTFIQVLYMAVALLVIAAVVLGIVVLYNLGVMSYIERYREMATLKVVGFKDKKIKGLMIGQNMWLTVIGIILGIFGGIGVLNWLMDVLAAEYEMHVVIGILSIGIGIIIPFAVSLLVSLMVSRKSKKIDMVVALKTPE